MLLMEKLSEFFKPMGERSSKLYIKDDFFAKNSCGFRVTPDKCRGCNALVYYLAVEGHPHRVRHLLFKRLSEIGDMDGWPWIEAVQMGTEIGKCIQLYPAIMDQKHWSRDLPV